MIDIQMESTLHDELVATLYNVPVLRTRPGRDSLLISIPSHDSWNRVDGNDEADLSIIVGHLKNTFLGDKEEEKTWTLLLFIDSACRKVEGTSRAKELRNLRERCVQCLKKALSGQGFAIIVDPLPLQINGTQPSQKLHSSESTASHLTLVKQEETVSEQAKTFPVHAISLLNEARQRIFEASDFFDKQLFVYVTPAQKRKAISCLEAAIEQFGHLLSLLQNSTKMPESITLHHQQAVDQINYLLEQLQMLIDWIHGEKAADSVIKGTFKKCKEALEMFIFIESVTEIQDSNHD